MADQNTVARNWPDYAQEERRKAALSAMDAVKSGKAKEIGLSDWMEAQKATAEQKKLERSGQNG